MIGMKFDYDSVGDSLFLWSLRDYRYDYSFAIDDVVIDIDEDGLPVAFEFLNASRWFDIQKRDFQQLEDIRIFLEVTDKFVCLNADLSASKNNSHIYRIRTNLDNFPTNNYEFRLEN